MDFDKSAELFKALSDPSRLKVLELLAQPPYSTSCTTEQSVCGCDLMEHLGLSQPTVSHHMRLLVAADLVTAIKRGRWTDYRINPAGLAQAKATLARFEMTLGASAEANDRAVS